MVITIGNYSIQVDSKITIAPSLTFTCAQDSNAKSYSPRAGDSAYNTELTVLVTDTTITVNGC